MHSRTIVKLVAIISLNCVLISSLAKAAVLDLRREGSPDNQIYLVVRKGDGVEISRCLLPYASRSKKFGVSDDSAIPREALCETLSASPLTSDDWSRARLKYLESYIDHFLPSNQNLTPLSLSTRDSYFGITNSYDNFNFENLSAFTEIVKKANSSPAEPDWAELFSDLESGTLNNIIQYVAAVNSKATHQRRDPNLKLADCLYKFALLFKFAHDKNFFISLDPGPNVDDWIFSADPLKPLYPMAYYNGTDLFGIDSKLRIKLIEKYRSVVKFNGVAENSHFRSLSNSAKTKPSPDVTELQCKEAFADMKELITIFQPLVYKFLSSQKFKKPDEKRRILDQVKTYYGDLNRILTILDKE